MKYILLIIFVFIFSKNLSGTNLFETEYYEIKFTSDNVENKKVENINKIKLNSINEIFRNILLESDFNEIKKSISEDQINIFIQNIILEDEKIINNNYYSKIKINFNKKKIINFLRKNKLNYVEYLPDNFLTIIYEKNFLNKNLFSKSNTHYKFLLKNKSFHKFYKLPKLDINDKYIVDYVDIENKNLIKILKLIEKYEVDHALIIIFNQEVKENNYTLYLNNKKNIYKVKEFTFDNSKLSDLFNFVQNEILNFWKSINSIQNEKINQIFCTIEYYNLLELKKIKKNLDNISIIKDITIKNISYRKNSYDILFYGNIDILSKLLKSEKLNIKINDSLCKINLI